MDKFTGRAYVFIPCYAEHVEAIVQDAQQDQYIDEIMSRYREEVAERNVNEFKRGLLGCFSFDFFGESERDVNCEQLIGSLYFSINPRTKLCILTVSFHVGNKPITQLLDRVSREGLDIVTEEGTHISFYRELEIRFGLKVAGKARVCLSTGEKLPEALEPAIFANEMYESDIMNAARLLPSFGQQSWKDNLALYDSSEIYASKTTVLRFDKTLDQKLVTNEGKVNAMRRDTMLIFIIELLMFREASIKRANHRVTRSIQFDDKLELTDISKLMGDFKAAIVFWDVDIFLYPSAQELADRLFAKFDIDRSLETYRKNQSYLEQRVNLSNAIELEKETRTINYIAVIVFLFEVVPLLFILSQAIIFERSVGSTDLFSSGIAVAASTMLLGLIVLIVKIRSFRKGWIKD